MLAKIRRFVAPPQFPDDDEKNRVAILLNTLLWLVFISFSFLTILQLIAVRDFVSTLSYAGTAFASLMLLLGLRKRYVRAVSWVTVIVFFPATIASGFLISGLNLGIITALMVIILMAGFLIGPSAANAFLVMTMIAGSLMVQMELAGKIVPPGKDVSNILTAGINFVTLGLILNITLRDIRNSNKRLRASNEEVTAIRDGLEQIVADRTRDLKLAADVGRSVSQIRELETLLQDAVDTIQERFGLYYVQIYLADKRQRDLSLKSGTGFVGKQLVRRGHRLSIGTGSINGIAALEKRVVLVADTAASLIFKPNSLLPHTRSEMAVPLVVGGMIMGVLNLQSEQAHGLSQDNVPAFEALAGQIAIAIRNANLFAETAEARAEIESHLRLVTREGWGGYQDGISQPEVLGMTYKDGLIQSRTQVMAAGPAANTLEIPIEVANELIGSIQLEADADHEWSAEDKDLIAAVARQVGQQAESLRLLSETEKYRAQAEESARRLSGQAWRSFLQDQPEVAAGFVYEQNKVHPLTDENRLATASETTIRQAVMVNNMPIGEILLMDSAQDTDQELIASVAEQLSSHIENLRLSQQNEIALAQTERLYQIGHALNSANNVAEILQAVLLPVTPTGITESTLMFIELNKQGEPESLEILANWKRNDTPSYPVGTCFPLHQFPFTGLFINNSETPTLIANAATDDRVDAFTKTVMAHAGIQAIAVIPLAMAGQWVGIVTWSWPEPHLFSKQEEEIANALINLAAPAVQSQRLFFKTKVQADKEQLINHINQRIQNTVSVESALQTAVKELGQALQATTQVKLNSVIEKQQTKHINEVQAVIAD